MRADARTPTQIFGNSVRYVVPLYQRTYVWSRERQWEPLWDDVRALAERVIAPVSGAGDVPAHFLGAVVVDQQPTPTGFIDVRHVVDGQQRLTTLQLLLDATRIVVGQFGSPTDAAGLGHLVANAVQLTTDPDEFYKVWPTNRDRAAFTAVMTGTGSADDSLIPQAHAYFRDAVQEWAHTDGPDAAATRLGALTQALAHHLKLVVIDLEPADNAQVIFESLNHRGTPLLAADLVKNLVFQTAERQGHDTDTLYRDHWETFDDQYWRGPQTEGRRVAPRIDHFLRHWLTMRLVQEVPVDSVFTMFRDRVVAEGHDIATLLVQLSADARAYAGLDDLDPTSVEGLFHYRVVRVLDSSVVLPFLLWLVRDDGKVVPVDARHRALCAVESWLVRRALIRSTAKDLNNAVMALLREVSSHDPAEAGARTEAFLDRQSAESRRWPDDESIVSVLSNLPLYRRMPVHRLRMVLEAIEDRLRASWGEGGQCPRGLTIEHVMPQSWESYWRRYLSDDEDVMVDRSVRVHRLGNLTLVSQRLNPTLSNHPWTPEQAAECGLSSRGKVSLLLEHSVLKLNGRLLSTHMSRWDDAAIDRRTAELIEHIKAIWPGPRAGHPLSAEAESVPVSSTDDFVLDPVVDPVVEDDLPEDDEPLIPAGPTIGGAPGNTAPVPSTHHEAARSVAVPASRRTSAFQPLTDWLLRLRANSITVSFSEIENILGRPLAPSARVHLPYWYNKQGSIGRSIRVAGWRPSLVDVLQETVTFVRDGAAVPDAGAAASAAPRRGAEAVAHLISVRLLTSGDVLHGRHRGSTHEAVVLPDGRLRSGGATYPSLSLAAIRLTGLPAVNGWEFWHTADGEPLSSLRERA